MNKKIYISNATLATEIFCYQYSIINNSAKNILTEFGGRCNNLLKNKFTKFYLDLFKFDIFVIRCLRGYFFPGHSVVLCSYVV